MTKVKFFLDQRRKMSDGTYPIRLYVSNEKRFYISTDFSCMIDDWDGSQFISNYGAKNIALRKLLNKIETFLLTSGPISDKALKMKLDNIINGSPIDTKYFVDYMKEYLSTKTAEGTRMVYEDTISKIEKYDPVCTFETMTKKWLMDFDNYLAKTMKVNSRSIHLRNVRAVFNYAIDMEKTICYPFRRFQIKHEETEKRAITLEQLRELRDFQIEEKGTQKFRDLFMLMFYLIGINTVDLYNLTNDNLRDGRLVFHRSKTNKLYDIRIEPEAQAIIDKYKGKVHLIETGYKSHRDFMHNMNNRLKKIGPVEMHSHGKKIFHSILPNISSYASRHTWATLASELDIPKETISAALGHEIGSSVTSIYIKLDKNKVDEANRKVIDYVNGDE